MKVLLTFSFICLLLCVARAQGQIEPGIMFSNPSLWAVELGFGQIVTEVYSGRLRSVTTAPSGMKFVSFQKTWGYLRGVLPDSLVLIIPPNVHPNLRVDAEAIGSDFHVRGAMLFINGCLTMIADRDTFLTQFEEVR